MSEQKDDPIREMFPEQEKQIKGTVQAINNARALLPEGAEGDGMFLTCCMQAMVETVADPKKTPFERVALCGLMHTHISLTWEKVRESVLLKLIRELGQQRDAN